MSTNKKRQPHDAIVFSRHFRHTCRWWRFEKLRYLILNKPIPFPGLGPGPQAVLGATYHKVCPLCGQAWTEWTYKDPPPPEPVSWVDHYWDKRIPANATWAYDLRRMPYVRKLNGGWIVFNKDPKPDGAYIKFAVFAPLRMEKEEDRVGALVFHGEGPSSYTVMGWHTNWGSRGYLFAPEASLISSAFRFLKTLDASVDFDDRGARDCS